MPSFAYNLNRRMVFPALLLAAGLCFAESEVRPFAEDLNGPHLKYESLMPGVDYARHQRIEPNLVYHVIRADLSQDELRMGVVKANPENGGKATVSKMATGTVSNCPQAVAVVNGDFFGHGVDGPWGPEICGGALYYSPTVKSAFMVDSNGVPRIDTMKMTMHVKVGDDDTWHPVTGMNRLKYFRSKGYSLFGYTKALRHTRSQTQLAATIDAPPPNVQNIVTGRVTRVIRTDDQAQVPSGDLLLCYSGKDLKNAQTSSLTNDAVVQIRTSVSPSAIDAVGGGPRLVRGGKTTIEFKEEKFSPSHSRYLTLRHPRSAAGISRDKKTVYMVIVEGRNKHSKGLAINDLASLMRGLGCWNAMMFDGGGSATLYTRKHTVTNQSNERHIMNGLAVFFDN